MTDPNGSELKIVRYELGEQTGEMYYQTEDGYWWKHWDGIDRTGQEVRTKMDGHIR